ncbi:MAG: hypothetical protein ACYC64_20270 [Armatimonadota bacterium]
MNRIVMTFVALAIMLSGIVAVYAASPQKSALVNIDLQNVTIEQGVSALFAVSGYKYTIAPGVSGRIVELRLKGITFDQALKAFADAAGFTYAVENGVYVIRPVPASSQSVNGSTTIVQQGSAKQPQRSAPPASVPYTQQQPAQNPPPANVASPAPQQQVVVNQTAPVYYGQPGGNSGYGYGYPPPYYQAGNLGFLYGWPPVTLGGINPPIMSFGPKFPPPVGWVGPDMLRFLRTQYAITGSPYFNGYLPGPGFGFGY